MNFSLIKRCFSLACAVFSVLIAQASIAQNKTDKAVKRPNVIVIYSDDQGYADLNIYGSKDLATPNLDRLARSGTRFTQFYAAAPICSPSRASLITGRYPQRAGLVGNAGNIYGWGGMPGSQYTMAEMFKAAGYTTGHIGKWHMGYSPETMPNAQGFDYSFGFMGGVIDDYSHFFFWGGPNAHDMWRNGKEIFEPGKYFPDLMVSETDRFLTENKNKPFFLYFAINLPHYPLQPEQKWLAYYKDLKRPRNMYAAYVSTMDEKIGLVLKKLDKLGLRKNTIVVFQSDQGFSKEDRTFGGGGSAAPYRGSKESLFEGGIRIPAFISWPGHIPVNAVRSQLATNIDWYVTLAEYCHISLPNRKIDGASITNVISSPTAKSPHEDFYWQCLGSKTDPQWAVREGEWKLLHNPLQAKPGDVNADQFMLIDMKTDSTEKVNLADQHPDVVQRLVKKYQDWISEVVNQ